MLLYDTDMTKPAKGILVVVTDQQRHDTIGELGHPLIRTPHLDQLCREGTAFTRAYTPSPVCVPARHALATGQPPHVTGVTDNSDEPGSGAAAHLAPSFMQTLADHGVQTHGVGKMHFTPEPYDHWGFDQRDTSEEGAHEPKNDDYVAFLHEHGFDHLDDYLGVRGEMYYIPQPSQVPERLHHSRWVADRSIDFLERRDRDRPFLLCSHFIRPHPPFESPVPWNKLYRADQMDEPFRPEHAEELLTYWNRVQNRYKWRGSVAEGGYDRELIRTLRAAYYASISYLDFQLGRMLDALGNDLDDTLVIFTSDHGELLGDVNSFGKRSMRDASARVPLIARWPGRLPAGSRCEDVATLLDVYPTVCAAVGVDPPDPSPEGRGLTAVARGEADRDVVYSQFQRDGVGLYMAVSRTHKYIYSEADQRGWGYDLTRDPDEANPLSEDDPAVVTLRQRLLHRFADDGYVAPLTDDGQGWRDYPKRSVPADPDEGLLYQDRPGLQASIDVLGAGYARPVTRPDADNYKLLRPHDA